MSAYINSRRVSSFRKRFRTSIIAGINLFHMNAAIMLMGQGRLGQYKLYGDSTIQAPARSTQDRGVHGSSSNCYWWLPLVGLITVALCLPFFRTVLYPGDEGVLLHGAERMLRGDRLYADFFELLPPGGFVLTQAWFSVAGISIGSVRSLAILTIVGIACFTCLACWQASKNAPLSAILATVWVLLLQGHWVQLNHHLLTTFFSMVAAWAALASIDNARRWLCWPLIAGLAAGMAAMVTPHRGVLAVLAAAVVFLRLWRHRAESIVYMLGCALVPACLLTYVVWHHAFAAAYDDVIGFTLGRYAGIQSVPFGFGGQNLPLKILFPLAASLTLLVCARDWRSCLRDRLLWQCAAFALAGLLGCFPRPDLAHIGFSVPLACPLLACCISRLTQKWRMVWWRYRYLVVVVAGVVIGFCVTSSLNYLRISKEALRQEIVLTPRGGVAFVTLPEAPGLLSRIAATPAGEAYFFYPYLPMLPFLTTREHVSKYDIFLPGYTLPSQYQDACISVMRHASWVVIDRRMTHKFLKQVYPAMRESEPRETKRFEQVLGGSFELVAQEGAFELRRRRQGIGETACAGIAE